jgi:hypothetical protein
MKWQMMTRDEDVCNHDRPLLIVLSVFLVASNPELDDRWPISDFERFLGEFNVSSTGSAESRKMSMMI